MTAPAAKGLTFHALQPGLIPWTLFGFIGLSALAHALAFFLFQSVYPRASRMGEPPVQVSLLTPGTPEADAIYRWMDADDPSLAAEPEKAPAPGLNRLAYVPSYATVHAQPVMAPAAEAALPDPAGASGLELVKAATAHPAATPEAEPAAATAVAFSGELAEGAPQPGSALQELRQSVPGELQPARFLLGVSEKGEVRYAFIQESSGDKGLDAAAGRMAERFVFRPSWRGIEWGFATFYWGSQVYANASREGGP